MRNRARSMPVQKVLHDMLQIRIPGADVLVIGQKRPPGRSADLSQACMRPADIAASTDVPAPMCVGAGACQYFGSLGWRDTLCIRDNPSATRKSDGHFIL